MKEKSNNRKSTSDKSLSVAVEQIAQLLRSEVKLNERKTQVLSASSLSASLKNVVGQVAKILRTQITVKKTTKRRAWIKRVSTK